MATIFGDTSGALADRERGGDQVLTGDSAQPSQFVFNTLYGDAAELLNRAKGGDDVLTGGSGPLVSNNLYGDAQTMAGRTRGGDDLLRSGSEVSGNNLRGDADAMSGRAHGGDDVLTGSASGGAVLDASFIGDADTMSDHTQGGDDVLIGPSGRSPRGGISLHGDAVTLSDGAKGGNDVIVQVYNDVADATLYGDAETLSGRAHGGDDRLQGYAFSPINTLFGDGRFLQDHAVGGDDVLLSAEGGFDLMWGDAAVVDPGATTGRDTFAFAPNNGQDHIFDFEHGKDVIDLTAFAGTGVHGFADLTIESGSVAFNGQTGSTILFDLDNFIFVADNLALAPDYFLFG